MTRQTMVREPKRRGMTLLVIVVLVMLISLIAYRYTFVMESEYRLTRLQEELVQARLSALSGIEYAAHLLEKPTGQRSGFASPGNSELVFRRRTAHDESRTDLRSDRSVNWQFGLISPAIEEIASAPSTSANSRSGSLGLEESIAWRWGVENESSKLSIPMMLNIESFRPGHFRSVLLALPGVDEETADAFLDQVGVRQPNSANRRDNSLSETVDRTLSNEQQAFRDRVRVVWFGGDLNQNYRLDPIEAQLLGKLSRSESGAISAGTGISTDSRWKPLQRYFTWMSGERNERPDGRPRIYLNQPNLQQLHQQLLAVYPAEVANFVIAYRQYGPNNGPSNGRRNAVPGGGLSPGAAPGGATTTLSSRTTTSLPVADRSQARPGNTTPNEMTISASEYAPQWTTPGTFMIQSSLDLVGAMVALPLEGYPSSSGGAGTVSSSASKAMRLPKKVLKSPFSSDTGERRNYFGKWLSETTVVDVPFLEGRVDVSEASVEVLRGVPGIDPMLAQRIVEQRQSVANNPNAMNSIAWLLESGMMDIQKLREIEPFITNRSDVYRVQSIGFRDNRSPVYRCTVTIDARRVPASVLDLKVWHPWDRGFDIDSLNGIPP